MPAGSITATVATAQQAMISKGVLPQASSPTNNPEETSLELLSALNLSVDYTTDRTFSLLTTETDAEVIENPNIIDTVKWEETVNANILTTNSFPSAADNFFTLDAGPDTATKRQREKVEKTKNKKNLTTIAANLVNYNVIDTTRPTLSQLK
jgi:hypothetical protein